jgi:hypothetical protein
MFSLSKSQPSFMTYYQVCNKGNRTGATSGAGNTLYSLTSSEQYFNFIQDKVGQPGYRLLTATGKLWRVTRY